MLICHVNHKKHLVIVESPAKAKTINEYLGKDYVVVSSYGHIRQLPSKSNSIIITEDDIKFSWEEDKKKVSNILKNLKNIDEVLLATDMDREGEAIAWHLKEIILENKFKGSIKRIFFYEITKDAILKSLENKRELDLDLINAYFTRSGLDYFVGFSLSPVLWQRFPSLKNQSAGRVQTPALQMIVQREFHRKNFVPIKYYSMNTDFKSNNFTFNSELYEYKNGKIPEKCEDLNFFTNIQNSLKAGDVFSVSSIKKKQIQIKPDAPYITSTLQREGNKAIGITSADVMKVAQTLYEGVKINNKQVALITYMRTDSTNMSKDAVASIRKFIGEKYSDYLPSTPNTYAKKVKNAQEAHECIRPTNIYMTPESIKGEVNDLQYKLYSLIWKKALASQMANSIREQISFFIEKQDLKFKTSVSSTLFQGFTCLFDRPEDNKKLNLKEKDDVILVKSEIKDHETQPKGRFDSGSFIKTLEEEGIGRPSTYASIEETLLKRGYVERKEKQLVPTPKGMIVSCFLGKFFTEYADCKLTAIIEEFLDDIAGGKINYQNKFKEFVQNLKNNITEHQKTEIIKIMDEVGDDLFNGLHEKCTCGNTLKLRMKFSIMFICEKCNIISKPNHNENQIDEDIKIVRTDSYSYILSNGNKAYLPQKFTEEIGPEEARLIISLPKNIEFDNKSFLLGMSKYGFYVKYLDKYYPMTFKQLVNFQPELLNDLVLKKLNYSKYSKSNKETTNTKNASKKEEPAAVSTEKKVKETKKTKVITKKNKP